MLVRLLHSVMQLQKAVQALRMCEPMARLMRPFLRLCAQQYQNYPDTPAPEDWTSSLEAAAPTQAVPAAPNQAPLPSRTRLYGDVLNPLHIAPQAGAAHNFLLACPSCQART